MNLIYVYAQLDNLKKAHATLIGTLYPSKTNMHVNKQVKDPKSGNFKTSNDTTPLGFNHMHAARYSMAQQTT